MPWQVAGVKSVTLPSVTPSMVGHVKPWGFISHRCLAEVTPGELKEGYMDVERLACCGKTLAGEPTFHGHSNVFATK